VILSMVRHGEPARAASGELQNDPPLSPLGVAQMQETGGLLRADGYDAVFASNLRRASESARYALGPDVPVSEVADLAEFDRDSDYLHYEDGADVWQRYREGDLSPWGTTAEEFRQRVVTALEAIRIEHVGERVVAVCHGGVINIFLAWILGESALRLFAPDYGSVSRFEYRADAGWSVRELNARPPTRAPGAPVRTVPVARAGASWN